MSRIKITAEQRKDWRNLPYDQWNVLTVQAYFADMNRELFGIESYLPMRNYGFEQGVIKRALSEHGAELLKRAFDDCFREYRPTREYPLLTAGFVISYRINTIIPRLKAEIKRDEQTKDITVDFAELAKLL
ncbi:hypothetical protein NQ117_05550 [Paenibacillus sp. SC116]|uniref:hypothetical protein n=1 Tax=Paenibacillus sp. SC116 TaxID=2968986 RepID=UPI00215A50CD|nr:hypothetical protein [Paenibacillus sp. SC116]MCR8843138.1 hypothetical protein [Paenibacillus sp. SC116]